MNNNHYIDAEIGYAQSEEFNLPERESHEYSHGPEALRILALGIIAAVIIIVTIVLL